MPYAVMMYGPSTYGTSDLLLVIITPQNGEINRTNPIHGEFILSSPISPISFSSLQVSLNSVPIVVDGYFTANATGTIDTSNPNSFFISYDMIHSYASLEEVVINIYVKNDNNDVLDTSDWYFVMTYLPPTVYPAHIARAAHNKVLTTDPAVDTTMPPTLTAVGGYQKIYLSWTDVVGAETYNLYYSLDGGFTFYSLKLGLDRTHYTHYGLPFSTTVDYTIYPEFSTTTGLWAGAAGATTLPP